ncbi:MAG TPA: hypothetical protein VM532_15780, partial [Burkholderiales bacterium]|nr:hypothetical protein [Burkholderiales bacterium]
MKFKFKLKALLSAGILSSISFASHALVLDAIDRGAYSDSGFHNSLNTNYITGDLRNGPPFYTDTHNFFVFDLSSVLGT